MMYVMCVQDCIAQNADAVSDVAQSTMNISSYTQRGSLAGGGGSYMANQVGANDNYPDVSAPQ